MPSWAVAGRLAFLKINLGFFSEFLIGLPCVFDVITYILAYPSRWPGKGKPVILPHSNCRFQVQSWHNSIHCRMKSLVSFFSDHLHISADGEAAMWSCTLLSFSLNKFFIIRLFSIIGKSDQIELPSLLQGSHYHWKTATSEYGAEVPFRNISFPGSKLSHCNVTEKNWWNDISNAFFQGQSSVQLESLRCLCATVWVEGFRVFQQQCAGETSEGYSSHQWNVVAVCGE